MVDDNDNSLLDADWDKLSPEKKAQLQALVAKLDLARVYKGAEGGMGAGGQQGQQAYAGIAALGGLPQDQLTALSRFRQYNLNQASDPNWQGPPQAPITGPIAPQIFVPARDKNNRVIPDQSMPPDMVTRAGMTPEQSKRSDVDNYYSMLAKPSQKPLSIPQEQAAAMPEQAPADQNQSVGQSFLQMIMDLAKGKK